MARARTPAATGSGGRRAEALRIDGLTMQFAGLRALDEVSFTVEPGELRALIGPNGAGKSSLLNCISGVYRPTSGTITYGDTVLNRSKPHAIAGMGVARVFQNVELFDKLSVLENVLLGRHLAMKTGVVAGMVWWGRASSEERVHRAKVDQYLEYCGLADVAAVTVDNLSYGVKKRVEYARALAMEPTLMLLDEPVAGMNESESVVMADLVRSMHSDLGISIVVVEHDMRFVMSLAEQVAVLDFGRIIADDAPDVVINDPAVRRAYLGGHAA
jgi:branched-chain amino acid transport system ATP-binding protein